MSSTSGSIRSGSSRTRSVATEDEHSPPPYTVQDGGRGIQTSNSAVSTSAQYESDGRFIINVNSKIPLTKLLSKLPAAGESVEEFGVDTDAPSNVPALSVLILIVGSRGDVQPFIPLAHELQKAGHRIRIGTHATFSKFVREQGIEFFDIGGDPEALMSYMVKNPSLLPGMSSLFNGDIGRKRKMMKEILDGCWSACYLPDTETKLPFVADAIIANPPSFGHIHCAEALSIPLHITFTMPWCTTQAFPHPLVNINSTNAEPGPTNAISYSLVDLLTWQGLGDVINDFRRRSLGLSSLGVRSASLLLERLRIPTNFCWSPALIPKPKDWGKHIDVTGFTFLESGPSFQPPPELRAFLEQGEAPVYIGFGSVPLKNSAEMTQIIFDAVRAAGVRALVSAGWAKLGEGVPTPEGVLILGNVPHDWLFKYVKAAVHHGGAGTTAIAVKEGRPNLVVPFFGDQPFWGEMISKAGAGPDPIHHKKLTVENLAEALRFLVRHETLEAAHRLGEQIRAENGAKDGADAFHKHLPTLNMRCDVDPSRAACYWDPDQYLRLSPFAVQVLAEAELLDPHELVRHRVKSYSTRAEIMDPLSGAAYAVARVVTDYTSSFGEVFVHPGAAIVKHVTCVPISIFNTYGNISEGVRNVPKLWGGRVRRVGPITNVASGFKEAGKGFYLGFQDGFSGLVTEPMRGRKEEGGVGVAKGIARGLAGLVLKPAAGSFGLFELPGRGVVAAAKRKFGPQAVRLAVEAATRERQGVEAMEASTAEQRQAVVDRWLHLSNEETLKERKKKIKKEIKEWEQGMDGAGLAEVRQNMLSHLERSKQEAVVQAGLATPLETPIATPAHSDDEEDDDDTRAGRAAKEQEFSDRYLNYDRHSAPSVGSSSSSTAPPAYEDHASRSRSERPGLKGGRSSDRV